MNSILSKHECIKVTRAICKKNNIHIPHYYNLIGNPFNSSSNKLPHPETGEITYRNSKYLQNFYKNSKRKMSSKKSSASSSGQISKKARGNDNNSFVLDIKKFNIGIAKSKNPLFKITDNKYKFLCPQCPEEKPLQYSVRSLICFKHKFKLIESGLQKLSEYLKLDSYQYPVCKECFGTTIGVTMNSDKVNFGLVYVSCLCENPMIIILDNSTQDDIQLSSVLKDFSSDEYKIACNLKDEKVAKEKELKEKEKSKLKSKFIYDKNKKTYEIEEEASEELDYEFVQ